MCIIMLNIDKLKRFYLALEAYNTSLSEQRDAIASQKQDKIDKSQRKTIQTAQALQSAERELVTEFGKIHKTENSNCMRTL